MARKGESLATHSARRSHRTLESLKANSLLNIFFSLPSLALTQNFGILASSAAGSFSRSRNQVKACSLSLRLAYVVGTRKND